jgi:hypothetical protein
MRTLNDLSLVLIERLDWEEGRKEGRKTLIDFAWAGHEDIIDVLVSLTLYKYLLFDNKHYDYSLA